MLSVHVDRPVGQMLDAAANSVTPELAKAVLRAANYGGGEIAKDTRTMFRKGTGALARSFMPAALIDSKVGIAAGALSDLVYADILNRGGTILAGKTAKMLAIPLTPQARTKWPRDWPKDQLQLIKSKRGNLILVEAKQKWSKGGRSGGSVSTGEKLIAHYVLKKSVDVDPRHYIDWATEAARPTIAKMVGEDIAAAVRQAMRGAK